MCWKMPLTNYIYVNTLWIMFWLMCCLNTLKWGNFIFIFFYLKRYISILAYRSSIWWEKESVRKMWNVWWWRWRSTHVPFSIQFIYRWYKWLHKLYLAWSGKTFMFHTVFFVISYASCLTLFDGYRDLSFVCVILQHNQSHTHTHKETLFNI